jgi:hypothetical protein
MDQAKLSRRRLLRNAAVAFPVGVIVFESAAAQAPDVPHVALDDPTAKALGYVHDAKTVDKTNPLNQRYEEGQTCANCVQLQGEAGAEWRPCTLFPGKLVAAAGWCTVWAKKPDA